jgi:hypothetical protein
MIVIGKHIPRRTVLRGVGATIALPLLDSMVPAFAAVRKSAANPVRRLIVVYVGNGMAMGGWTPPTEGPLALPLPTILQPIAAFKDRVLVLSGLDNKAATAHDAAAHPRCQTAYLTGTLARRTEGPGIRAGTSMDQIAANELGHETPLASLELSLETEAIGTCVAGYSCAYSNTISWRSPTMPLPMESNPRAVFTRLFRGSETTDPRARRVQNEKDRSTLDSVIQKVTQLRKRLGPGDAARLNDYLESVRDVEQRVQKAEREAAQDLPVVERPTGIPDAFEDHAKLMFDLLALAYQCDLTRISTYVLSRELSFRAYPEIGVPEPHHPLSHHGDKPENIAKLGKVNTLHMQLFAYFLAKLESTPHGDGSLLDQTLILYGGGLSDSNKHVLFNVPTLVMGPQVRGGRHVRFPQGTPLTNLYLNLLQKMGVAVEQFGDSTGALNVLSDI